MPPHHIKVEKDEQQALFTDLNSPPFAPTERREAPPKQSWAERYLAKGLVVTPYTSDPLTLAPTPLSWVNQQPGSTMAGPTAAAPSNTVYVRNLHDRVKITEMETALRTLFEDYGTIVDIVAKTNLKAKGQAFIVFDNQQSAARAIEDIDGFPLFDKPMSCAFARTRSDATVKREGNEAQFEEHKKTRLANKELKKAQEAQQAKLKRPAPTDQPDSGAQQQPRKGLKSTAGSKAGVVPEEYLPPNKILFVRNLPEEYDADELSTIFGRFAGFKEARIVPGRAGIAFIEYATEEGAINAKKNTSGMTLGDNAISVFFQRS